MAEGTIRRAFLRGLAALLPTALTVIIFVKVYEFIAGSVGKAINSLIAAALAYATDSSFDEIDAMVPSVVGTFLALILIFLVAVFVGLVLASLIGRKAWGYLERRLFGFPLVRLVYPSLKQITDFIFGEQRLSFKRVGLLEYPRKGVYSIGFITGSAFETLTERTGRDMVTFFIPSSPTPFTGYCVQVAREEVMELDVPVEAAIRYTVSGGVIVPVAEGGAAHTVALVESRIRKRHPGGKKDED